MRRSCYKRGEMESGPSTYLLNAENLELRVQHIASLVSWWSDAFMGFPRGRNRGMLWHAARGSASR
jgi:hypothetical protein